MRVPPAAQLRGDIAGGAASALVTVPGAMSLGILAFAPLGPGYAAAGILAALTTQVLSNLVNGATSSVRCQITGARASSTTVIAGLIAALAAHPAMQRAGGPDVAEVLVVVALTVMLAGLLQALFGLARLGGAIKFIPYPVVAGFMDGIALLILVSQIPALLGLPRGSGLFDLLHDRALLHGPSFAAGIAAIASILAARRYAPRLPVLLCGLVAGTVVYHLLSPMAASRPGLVVGALPVALPTLQVIEGIASLDWYVTASAWTSVILPTALFLAGICALDGLLAAMVTETLTGGRHDANRELMGQGLANMAVALLGALPAIGGTTPPIANYLAGGRTRLSEFMHAAWVFAAVWLLAPALAFLPFSVLAALMLYMAVMLFDQWSRHMLLRAPQGGPQQREVLLDLAVVAAVALSMVLANVLVAVAIGVSAAIALMLVKLSGSPVRRTLDATVRSSLRVRPAAARALLREQGHRIRILELHGELFFGTADPLQSQIDALAPDVRYALVDLRSVNEVDASGARVLEVIGRRGAARGVQIVLSHVTRDDRRGSYLRALGVDQAIASDFWFADLDHALEWAEDRILEEAGWQEPAAELPAESMSLFDGLTDGEMRLLRNALERRELGDGEPVFHEGEEGDTLYLIARGAVDIEVRLGDARARRLATFNAGVMFGEMALIEGERRSADAFARGEAVVLYALASPRLQEILRENGELGAKIYRNLSRELTARLRATTGALRALE